MSISMRISKSEIIDMVRNGEVISSTYEHDGDRWIIRIEGTIKRGSS